MAGVGRPRRGRERGKGRRRTLPASERPWHKAYAGDEPLPKRTAWKQEKERKKNAAEAERRRSRAGGRAGPDAGDARGTGEQRGRGTGEQRGRGAGRAGAGGRRGGRAGDGPELLVGRNPVVEALRVHTPATTLYVAQGIDLDDRVHEVVRTAANRGLPIMEISRAELDRMTGGVPHQGVGLQVPPYAYLPFEDLLAAAQEHPTEPLLVALDGVTDPRNLGAVVRSAAAFGAHGVFLPARRAAGVTATAWRASAGAAARVPVSRVTNLTRALRTCQDAGFVVVGLDADAALGLYDLEVAVGPLVLVLGSEGRGLSRLVGETCDLRVSIPMTSEVESLNASVAGAVALAEVSRKRGAGSQMPS